MIMDKEVLKQWSRMLQDLDPRAQMEALTQIGRAYFRPEVGPREGKDIKGAIRVKGPAKPGLPASLRDAILEKLQAEDPRIRAEAALALVHWRDKEAIEAIKQMLNDRDRTVRLAVIQTLATMGDAQFIPSLLEVAEGDPEELVRAHALSAIEAMPEEEVVKVEGKPVKVRGAARTRGGAKTLAESLEQIADSDPSSYVAFLARRARKRFASRG